MSKTVHNAECQKLVELISDRKIDIFGCFLQNVTVLKTENDV